MCLVGSVSFKRDYLSPFFVVVVYIVIEDLYHRQKYIVQRAL